MIYLMKKQRLLLVAGLMTFVMSGVVRAQVGPTNETENYSPDGTYWGTPVHSVDVDFTKWSTTDLVMNEELQEKDNIGFYKFVIAERTFPPAWEASVCLHNNNPVLPLGNNQKEMAKIYFPTMADGAGAIRIVGYVSDNTARPIQLNYFVEGTSEKWEWKGGITLPNKSGDEDRVEAAIDIPGKVRIGLFYNQAAWPSIKSISISAYGENLPTGVSETVRPESIRMAGDCVLLGEECADVLVYSLGGQLVQELRGVTGRVVLPSGTGIVKVVAKDRVVSFKKL